MAAPLAAMSGVPYKLQDATTTGVGNILAVPSSFRNHTFLIKGSAGVASGAVVIESANDYLDTNTWGIVAAVQTVLANTDILITVAAILNFVRARISTTVTGGTVTVEYLGAKSY